MVMPFYYVNRLSGDGTIWDWKRIFNIYRNLNAKPEKTTDVQKADFPLPDISGVHHPININL